MPSFNKILLPLKAFFVPKKMVTPRIAIGLGSADRELPKEFQDVEVVKIRELMLKHLDGDQEKITKMSPREITALAKNVLDDAKATGVVFSGSTNTMADFFQNKNAEMPKRLDIPAANSIFKMAQSVKALSEETPSMYSCDGVNYPTVALGGAVAPVVASDFVKHDGTSKHDIIVKKGSRLAKEAAKISNYRDDKGNVIIRNTPSTHPLFITRVPVGAEVLAQAPDGSPCIVAFNKNTVGIMDHPEVGAVKSDADRKSEEMSSRIFGEDFLGEEEKDSSEQNKLFWKILRDQFIKNASQQQDTPPPVPSTKFCPRIDEILNSPSIEQLSATRVSMAMPDRNR